MKPNSISIYVPILSEVQQMNKYLVSCFTVLLITAPPIVLAKDWDFRLNPYIWLAGLEGNVATIPGLPSVPIDVSSRQAFEDTEASLMLFLDAKRGKHGFFADAIYTDVQSNNELVPSVDLTLQSVSKTRIFSLAYQYEFYRSKQTFVDVMVGARYWNIDIALNFGGGLGLLSDSNINNNKSWVDPAIGVKGFKPLGDSGLYLEGGGGFGGFGAGSELFYEFTAGIGYQWNAAIGTTLGYRLFDVDFKDNEFTYDVKQQGWQIGLRWSL